MCIEEDIYHAGGGIVCGRDTERVVAEFSYEYEAEAFCEMVTRPVGRQLVRESAIDYLYKEWHEAYKGFYNRL